MTNTLTEYMVRLALDSSALGEFLLNPATALSRSDLDSRARAVLNSNNTNLIYAALVDELRERASDAALTSTSIDRTAEAQDGTR